MTFPALNHVALTVRDLSVSGPWYKALIGSEPVLDPPAQFYQRMLSMESEDMLEVANKFIFLHQGRIEEQGNPKEIFANPKSDRLKAFLTTAHHK